MSNRLADLADRRRTLVAQSDALRAQLSGSTQGMERILGIADLGVSAARYPLLLLLGIGFVVSIVKPRRIVRTMSFALTALSIVGQVRRILAAGSNSRPPRPR